MKFLLLILVTTLLFASCNSNPEKESSSQVESENTPQTGTAQHDSISDSEAAFDRTALGPISKLKVGMTTEEVRAIMGEPKNINNLSANKENATEDWFYGEKQKIRMVRGAVNRIVYDTEKEVELIKELLEAREDGDEARAKELMEKLKKNQY